VEASSVTCPKCQHIFPLSAAIEQPIVEKLQQQHEQKLAEERKKIVAEQAQKAKDAVGLRLADLEAQLTEKSKKLESIQKEQLELLRQKRQLDEQKQLFEVEKAKQIEAERQKIRDDARKSALEEMNQGVVELQQKLAAKDKKLVESQEAERKLRQEMFDFEERKMALDLEVARKTEAVKEEVSKKKDEEFRLKEVEFAKKEEDWKRQVEQMKQKVEQGSQQAQGEALEVDLGGRLRRCFYEDEILDVPKGTHGGDLIQGVKNDKGDDCGTIIWECKRTKIWKAEWLAKLKDDRLAAKAQIAVIVSVAKPKDLADFECREGVWVTTPSLAMPLAAVLRQNLIEVAAARRSMEGRHDKIEVMYDYISGPQFQARMRAIIDEFKTMRKELEAEKTVIQSVWAKREMQIERVKLQATGMYGDLQAIIGKAMPKIDYLELTALADESGKDPHFKYLQDTPIQPNHGHASTPAHATPKGK
jgi:hypothetical protein